MWDDLLREAYWRFESLESYNSKFVNSTLELCFDKGAGNEQEIYNLGCLRRDIKIIELAERMAYKKNTFLNIHEGLAKLCYNDKVKSLKYMLTNFIFCKEILNNLTTTSCIMGKVESCKLLYKYGGNCACNSYLCYTQLV